MGTHSFLKIKVNNELYLIYYQFDGYDLYANVVNDIYSFGNYRELKSIFLNLPVEYVGKSNFRDDDREMD